MVLVYWRERPDKLWQLLAKSNSREECHDALIKLARKLQHGTLALVCGMPSQCLVTLRDLETIATYECKALCPDLWKRIRVKGQYHWVRIDGRQGKLFK